QLQAPSRTRLRREKTCPQRLRHLIARHMPEPCPRERAKGHLQRARPVDSPQKRIRVQPALHLPECLVEILPPTGQPERLRQQREVLVSVQFPDHLVVATREKSR